MPEKPYRRGLSKAFTLVELLVVIAIIVLLIAILLPTLGAAREAGNRVKCLATLRSMQQAAMMHAQDHRGYMPIAGYQGPTHLGADTSPKGLLDPSMTKYRYYLYDGESPIPLPLPSALGYYMGLGPLLRENERSFTMVDRVLATDAVRMRFACASQDPDSVLPNTTITDGNVGLLFPRAYMSYVFNSAALSRLIGPWGETPAGNLNRIRRHSEVFLFADGNAVELHYLGYGVTLRTSQDTLYEGFWGGNRRLADFQRHRGRINVMFVDGHGETLMLPDPKKPQTAPGNTGDLQRIGVSKGIFE